MKAGDAELRRYQNEFLCRYATCVCVYIYSPLILHVKHEVVSMDD